MSLLCDALMAALDMCLKVSTPPVVTLGVGVDHGIYLFEALQHQRQRGAAFEPDLRQALQERSTAIWFTAVTISIGIGSWYFSPLKFQADMGMLLAFIFIVNAVGALLLTPALVACTHRSARRRRRCIS